MPPTTISRKSVREVDRRAIEDYGLPGVVLMENAARGCVDWLCELGINGPVVICAGKGNNGGDGFVMARHLANRGITTRVLLFAREDELQGDAAINWNVLRRADANCAIFSEVPSAEQLLDELSHADWIIDALLGTGTQGSLREPYRTVIEAINNSQRRVFAVDLPSGLDCDSGLPVEGASGLCIQATVTATFVARKQGFDHPDAACFTGEVQVIDIGVPVSMFDDWP
jgi:NAD(P)H-hydrate epimerase